MFWSIIICLLLALPPVIFFIHYFDFSRECYRDKAFFAVNKIRGEVFMKLLAHESADNYSEPKAIELENLYAVADDMAENMSLLESNSYKFETLIEVYKRIIVDETVARQMSVIHLPEYLILKRKFSKALSDAFKINFFFRYRLTFYIARHFIYPLYAINKRIAKKIHNAVTTYNAVKAASNEPVLFAC